MDLYVVFDGRGHDSSGGILCEDLREFRTVQPVEGVAVAVIGSRSAGFIVRLFGHV